METILLVEDDEMISEIYEKKLVQSGYSVELSMNGEDAVKKMQAKTYNLVLLDLVLPGLNGISVLQKLSHDGKNKLPSPTIVFSNLNDPDNQEAAFRYGASGFLPKSQFNPSELVQEVQRHIRESQEREKNDQKRSQDNHSHQSEMVDVIQQKHILFVEDEEVFVSLFVDRLKKEGYRVTVAQTGVEALDVLKKEGVDIVVTDVLLPTMRGDEFIMKIRHNEELKSLPILVISASATDEQVAMINAVGVQGFFLKTRITPSELAMNIKNIIG